MERKYYEKKFTTVKSDILEEIRTTLGYNEKHDFKEPFFIHYVDGEVATTEECLGIKIDNNGMVIIVYRLQGDTETLTTESEAVFRYSCESFIDFIDNLKKELREEKLSHLRDIVKRHNGLSFDGGFKINIDERDTANNECAIAEDCLLVGLRLTTDGKLGIVNIFDGETFTNEESALLYEDIDRLITYVECQTSRKFVIRVSGSFSRTFDVEASNYEEALAIAQKDWDLHPLCSDDSNGEDWEDYTSCAN